MAAIVRELQDEVDLEAEFAAYERFNAWRRENHEAYERECEAALARHEAAKKNEEAAHKLWSEINGQYADAAQAAANRNTAGFGLWTTLEAVATDTWEAARECEVLARTQYDVAFAKTRKPKDERLVRAAALARMSFFRPLTEGENREWHEILDRQQEADIAASQARSEMARHLLLVSTSHLTALKNVVQRMLWANAPRNAQKWGVESWRQAQETRRIVLACWEIARAEGHRLASPKT